MKNIIAVASLAALTLFVTACGDSDLAAVKSASCRAKEIQTRMLSGQVTPDDVKKIYAESDGIRAELSKIEQKHMGDADWAAKAGKVAMEGCK